jgi:hypothetical protein
MLSGETFRVLEEKEVLGNGSLFWPRPYMGLTFWGVLQWLKYSSHIHTRTKH